MTHLSLFSGVGGLDLAAHWAGFETVQFVEREPYCQKILAKNFPGVPIHDDVTTFDGRPFRGRITCLSGGFPCQDVSHAGKQLGVIHGHRSNLFLELLRVAGEVQPDYIVMENVTGLLGRGFEHVLAGLAQLGFDAEWGVLSACALGAPFMRKRVFIVAYANGVNGSPRVGTLSQKIANECRNDKKGSQHWLQPYTGVRGVASRVSRGMDKPRLTALGNSVSPYQAYPIFQAIAKECRA